MLKEQAKLFNRLAVVFDLCLISISFFLAYLFRNQFSGGLRPVKEYAWILIAVFPIWCFLLERYKLYASIRRLGIYDIVVRLVNVHLYGGVIVSAIIYFIDRDVYSRGLFLSFVFFSFLLLTLERTTIRAGLGAFRRKGYNFRNLLIVGTREKARRFHLLLREHDDWGLKVLGFVQVVEKPLIENIEGHEVLGHVRDLIEICKKHPVDEVVFCLPKDLFVDAEEYVQDLEELGITVRMVLDFYDVRHSRRELSFFHNELPILTFHAKAFESQELFLKRILDILGALVGLTVTAILSPFIIFAIKMDSPGPIFFGQERMGESGRIFKCWKFRSMYIDAEERKKDLMDQNEMSGAIFKMKDDPRITRVGKFIRKTSIDELPQFWNVLKGEMSLVGTRPPTLSEVAEYENWHRRRISIKPGISGLWQVSGRNAIEDFDEIVKLDLQYIDNWSLWLDVKILLKTIGVVFARRGSC